MLMTGGKGLVIHIQEEAAVSSLVGTNGGHLTGKLAIELD